MKWNVITSTIPGKYNVISHDTIRPFVHSRMVCIVVADGASSARFSREGSHAVSNGIVDRLIVNKLDTLSDIYDCSHDSIRNLIYSAAMAALRDKAEKLSSANNGMEVTISDLSATMMCFITDGNRYVAANIGDGLIGKCTPDNTSEIILRAESLMYANQTYYITDDNALEHLNVKTGKYERDCAYVMMTDGTIDCTYDKRNRKFAPIVYKFCALTHQYDRTISNTIHDKMRELFPKRTHDDCALAIITGKQR